MKKFVAVALVLVMTLGLTSLVFANPGQNPNRNPGAPEVQVATITITATGGGNNLVLRAINADGAVQIIPRAGNGTFTQTFAAFGYTGTIRVQGNSLREVTITGFPAPPAPPEPYVVREYSFYRFVRLNQVDSYFTGTSEVEGSREFVNGAAVKYNWVRTNEIPGVNGMGVISGARVTGTLNYQFVRNYVEQFERVYEWVDVTVWSNGDRDEVVREDSEHVRGGLVDGKVYSSDPFNGSRAIDVTSEQVVLHMGHGQSDAYGRFVAIAGGFSLALELHNTGNPPTITVTITEVDLAAL